MIFFAGNHTITGKKTFVDGINAEQSINVTGNVDTVDLSAWANDVMMLSSDQTIQGIVTLQTKILTQYSARQHKAQSTGMLM